MYELTRCNPLTCSRAFCLCLSCCSPQSRWGSPKVANRGVLFSKRIMGRAGPSKLLIYHLSFRKISAFRVEDSDSTRDPKRVVTLPANPLLPAIPSTRFYKTSEPKEGPCCEHPVATANLTSMKTLNRADYWSTQTSTADPNENVCLWWKPQRTTVNSHWEVGGGGVETYPEPCSSWGSSIVWQPLIQGAIRFLRSLPFRILSGQLRLQRYDHWFQLIAN